MEFNAETKEWVFNVPHFTKFGLAGPEDSEDEEEVKKNEKPFQIENPISEEREREIEMTESKPGEEEAKKSEFMMQEIPEEKKMSGMFFDRTAELMQNADEFEEQRTAKLKMAKNQEGDAEMIQGFPENQEEA